MIAVVSALYAELHPLVAHIDDRRSQSCDGRRIICGTLDTRECVLCATGIGYQAMRSMLDALSTRYTMTEIISIGTAGALSPLLSVGDLLLPACIMNRCAGHGSSEKRDAIAINCQHENVTPPLPIRTGTLVTTSHPVWSKTERENMHTLTGADAVDMEGYAVARFSRARAIPLTILRYIADDYDPCGRALFKRRVATGAHHLAEATRRAAALSAVVPYWA